MKLLLLGKKGQVGWELQRSLAPLGELVACGRQEVDLEKHQELRHCIRHHNPDIVINAAAYTAVDKAESEPDRALNINAKAVAILAEEVKRLNGWLVHYSTEYVFDGLKDGPYLETDETSPQTVYGRSKVEGEEAIQSIGCRHLSFRTSWVFAARGNNFAKTMLRLAKERKELTVVADQIGAPTSAELIADVTALCLYRTFQDTELGSNATGIYHLVAGGETSWNQYARCVISEAARHGIPLTVTPDRVLPILTSDYPTPAHRPANSRLSTQKLRDTFGVTLPDWQQGVARVVRQILGSREC